MSISPERLENAFKAFNDDPSGSNQVAIEYALERDDEWRASHPDGGKNMPDDDVEPELPSCVKYEKHINGKFYYFTDSQLIIPECLDASDLRLVANHKEWRERQKQREEAKPELSEVDKILISLGKLSREDRLRIAQSVNIYVQDYEAAAHARDLRADKPLSVAIDTLINVLKAQRSEAE